MVYIATVRPICSVTNVPESQEKKIIIKITLFNMAAQDAINTIINNLPTGITSQAAQCWLDLFSKLFWCVQTA